MDDETREAIVILLIVLGVIVGAFITAQIWLGGGGNGPPETHYFGHLVMATARKSPF